METNYIIYFLMCLFISVRFYHTHITILARICEINGRILESKDLILNTILLFNFQTDSYLCHVNFELKKE